MNWIDWLLIGAICSGMVIRIIGRSIMAHASIKYKDDSFRREKERRLGKTVRNLGSIVSIVMCIGFIVALALTD